MFFSMIGVFFTQFIINNQFYLFNNTKISKIFIINDNIQEQIIETNDFDHDTYKKLPSFIIKW